MNKPEKTESPGQALLVKNQESYVSTDQWSTLREGMALLIAKAMIRDGVVKLEETV